MKEQYLIVNYDFTEILSEHYLTDEEVENEYGLVDNQLYLLKKGGFVSNYCDDYIIYPKSDELYEGWGVKFNISGKLRNLIRNYNISKL